MNHTISPYVDEEGEVAWRCACGADFSFQRQAQSHARKETSDALSDTVGENPFISEEYKRNLERITSELQNGRVNQVAIEIVGEPSLWDFSTKVSDYPEEIVYDEGGVAIGKSKISPSEDEGV